VPGRDVGSLDRVVSDLRGRIRDVDPSANPIETRSSLGYLLRR
jgi:hypothetical protein